MTVLSVAGLTEYIQALLEGDRHLQRVWVTGEVSSLKDHARGLFFTLSDEETEATINCVVWNSQREKLMQPPQYGEQILVLGSISLYPKRGDYKLVVYQSLATGFGLQALQYQQLRSRLASEGFFDSARKRLLPTYPRRVAVVTSPTAAAWGDIQRTLNQRYRGLQVLFAPATVQGNQAPNSIVAAIERVNRDGRAEVLILARGGGATEDLSCFNDERVVRAIAESAIPIITGIGHQQDESLADLVADVSAHTPTAAAEIAVAASTQLISEHQQRLQRLVTAAQRRFKQELEELDALKTRLKRLTNTSRQLLQSTAHLTLLKEKLIVLDPQAVLERGYALVKDENNNIVNSATNLMPDQELTIQLDQGLLKVKIIDIEVVGCV